MEHMDELRPIRRYVRKEDCDFMVGEVVDSYAAFCFTDDPDHVEQVAENLAQAIQMEFMMKNAGQWNI